MQRSWSNENLGEELHVLSRDEDGGKRFYHSSAIPSARIEPYQMKGCLPEIDTNRCDLHSMILLLTVPESSHLSGTGGPSH
jgi:hypothetical protein